MADKKLDVNKDLVNVTTAVAEITKTQAGIAELKKRYGNAVFDVTSKTGMDDAKKARAEIRAPRYNVEHLRKAAKAPVIELGKTIDAIATDITSELLALENPIDGQIKAEEKRVADAKQAIIDAERKRVTDIRERIEAIYNLALVPADQRTVKVWTERLRILNDMTLDGAFDEYANDAMQTWQAAHNEVTKELGIAREREAAEEQARKDREELEKLRKEKEKRDAAEAAEQARKQAIKDEADRKAAAAVAKQKADQEKAQAAIDAASEKLRKDREAFEQAQRDEELRKAQEAAAEKARKDAADAAAKLKAEQEQEAARRAIYPGDAAIINCITLHFGVPISVGEKWLQQIKGAKKK